MDAVTEEVREFASKATIIPFSIFTSMFHQRFAEHRFLESTLELLQQFYLQAKSIEHDYKTLLVINQSSVSSVFVVEKE